MACLHSSALFPSFPLQPHLRDPLWEEERSTTEAVLCCSLSAVTPVRIKQAQYLNHLSEIPRNPFLEVEMNHMRKAHVLHSLFW